MRWLVLLGWLASGCTIDVGTPPDAAACAASPDLFVSSVYPNYLVPNRCGSSGCHSFSDGHGVLRIRDVDNVATPAVGQPLETWPLQWRQSYLSAARLVRCDAPLESRLLVVPEGQGNLHPPGPVVLDRRTANAIIQAWVGGGQP
jgi:hypothetical protein